MKFKIIKQLCFFILEEFITKKKLTTILVQKITVLNSIYC